MKKGRPDAEAAGVQVDFYVDDPTHLRHVSGTFDLLVDYGRRGDLVPQDRDLFVKDDAGHKWFGTQNGVSELLPVAGRIYLPLVVRSY